MELCRLREAVLRYEDVEDVGGQHGETGHRHADPVVGPVGEGGFEDAGANLYLMRQ